MSISVFYSNQYYLVGIDPLRRSQHADRILGDLGEDDAAITLPQTSHQIGSVIPELPPTFVQPFVTLQGIRRPGGTDDFHQETICLGPSFFDLPQSSVTDVQRPPPDVP